MPRPRRNPLFEIAGQWIAHEPARAGLWRYWYDARTQRVRRAPLGVDDLEQAKLILAAHVLRAERPGEDSALAEIMLRYHEQRTDALRSAKMARTATRKALTFLGQSVSVSEAVERAGEFATHLAEQGASLSYIARIMGVLAAGLSHAGIRTVTMPSGLAWLEKQIPNPKAPRRVAIPTDRQFEQALSAPMGEPLFVWMVISLATGARPEAALDLLPVQRRDGLVDLNPPGRRQNKKYRPVVREPGYLAEILDRASPALDGRYVSYGSVSSIQTALDRLELPFRLSAYSFRHKVVTVLRRAKRTHGVTEDDIAWQMGHRRPHLRVTGLYGESDPDYLDAPCRALDDWLKGLEFSRRTPAKTAKPEPATGESKAKAIG